MRLFTLLCKIATDSVIDMYVEKNEFYPDTLKWIIQLRVIILILIGRYFKFSPTLTFFFHKKSTVVSIAIIQEMITCLQRALYI